MYTPGWCRAGLREQAVEVDLGPERLSVFERAARNDFLFPAGFFEHLDVAEDVSSGVWRFSILRLAYAFVKASFLRLASAWRPRSFSPLCPAHRIWRLACISEGSRKPPLMSGAMVETRRMGCPSKSVSFPSKRFCRNVSSAGGGDHD